jgi:NTE family protein
MPAGVCTRLCEGNRFQMKVGLVLGAGGVLGGAWLVGGLSALAKETGWDPGSADNIVGTSAGSMIGALVAGGVPPWFMVAHSRGESFEGLLGPDGRPASQADRSAGASFRVHRGLPAIGPGSLRMAFTALSNPLRHTPLQMVAGWVPAGFVSTDSLKEVVTRAVPGDWVEHPSYWAVACDYESGRRTPFGRLGSPRAHIGDAVAASCAIPGFYHPVAVEGRRYVDGGVCSLSNLDLLAGRGLDLDLVVCLNPTSSVAEAMGGTPAERVGALMRGVSGRRLAHEARKLHAEGTEVLLLQPSREDVVGMGVNLMARGRRVAVLERARRTTAVALRDLRGADQLLPERNRRRRAKPVPVRRSQPQRHRRAA